MGPLLLALTGVTLLAQPRQVEIFGMAGAARVSGDEGSLGSGVAFGGAVTLPFSARWAIDLDLMHGRADRDEAQIAFRTRRTYVSPALQYRRGNGRLYGFAAAGAGFAKTTGDTDLPERTISASDSGLTWHGRGGIVAGLTGRLLLRAEVFTIFRYVSPDVGVRAGLGFRF